MTKQALIVGGNLASVQAALDLARSGIPVTLMEHSPFLGHDRNGRSTQTLLLEAVKHPLIRLYTNSQVTAVHGRKGAFQVEMARTPRYVDLEKCTACGDCVEVCPISIPVGARLTPTQRAAIFGGGEGAVPNVYAIEKRGVAPCKATCPGGIHVQGYVALIAQGRFQEALALIRDAVPFPGVLGRVCYHPCEDACRRGIEEDEPVSICALKRFVADYEVEHAPPISPSSGEEEAKREGGEAKRIAIIGAGPVGLTVAYFLAQAGVECEVFEALPVAGGMLAVGIPDYRLPPDVLQREIAAVEALGVTIHLNHLVDQAEWRRLREEYDVVFVGVGAHKPRRLQIPGDELEGVVPGVELLRQANLAGVEMAQFPAVGKHVVVIGGGNTAIDSAMVARRLGAEKVTVLYRRSRPEMLANPWEIEEAEQEGVEFHFLASPIQAVGENGKLVALDCIRNELGEPDQSGRRRPVPVEGSEFTIPCDTLLPAIGQVVDCGFEDLAASRWGSIQVDPVTLQTNLPNVFAGGDAVIGPASVVESIGDGRRAVESILRYLGGEDLAAGRTAERVDISQYDYYTPAVPVVRARVQMPHVPMEARRTFAEVALGLSQEQAVAEAERCLSCGVCSECLACVVVCQPKAIDHSQLPQQELLEAGVVIWADVAGPSPSVTRGNIYELHGNDPLVASAVAAQAMADLALYRQTLPFMGQLAPTGVPRIGVFVCRCGERIGGVLDVDALVSSSARRGAVVHAQDLAFACQPEGAAIVRTAMREQKLDRVVLAACSCCSLDQVCDSCTYQRVRCKSNLLDLPDDLARLPAEFVNIREQCAWAHRDEPALGTAKAERLIAAAVNKIRLLHGGAVRPAASFEARALIIGEGSAAGACAEALQAQQFAVVRLAEIPHLIEGTLGRYVVAQNGSRFPATVVVLAPSSPEQLLPLLDKLDHIHYPPSPTTFALKPGLFYCPPAGDPEMIGAAVAAKVGATLGSGRAMAAQNVARVNPAHCRACGTCERLCESQAIRVVELAGRMVAQVEPLLCQGCGICAAHCPSSAIDGGYSTDQQIEAMLEAILGVW